MSGADREIRRFRVDFLGCKVNQYEAQALRESLLALGLAEAEPGEPCDLVVLNTCAVTREAEAKSRREIRRAHRTTGAAVVVTGCHAEASPADVASLPGVVSVVPNAAKDGIPGRVATELLGMETAPAPPAGITGMKDRTRAFVKIVDGCDDTCSYCIIPALRGGLRSRRPEDVVAEIAALARAGVREIVLSGVQLGGYGRDLGRRGLLPSLLRDLAAVPGLPRLKLSSLEPHEITRELLDVWASDPRFLPHFHLPVQSGDDGVLRAMRRKYTTARFLRRLETLRTRIADPAITTDLIVGFPGETPEAHRRSLRFCRAAGFAGMHVFPFSERPLTAAADLPDRVPPDVIAERVAEAIALGRELSLTYRARLAGAVAPVLLEARRDADTGALTGLSDRGIRVIAEGPDELMGRIVPVEITEVTATWTKGRLATTGRRAAISAGP